MTPSGNSSEDQEWLRRLSSLRQRKNTGGDKWLQILYDAYQQRFILDNNRIWSISQWMIPLALAPLVGLPNLPRPVTSTHALYLAIPSIALIWVWFVITENHRAFQQNSYEWLAAIEDVLKINKPGGPKVRKGLTFISPCGVRVMRLVLAVFISFVWIATIGAIYCGKLSFEEPPKRIGPAAALSSIQGLLLTRTVTLENT